MVGSSQTDLPSVTDPRTWESTHRILSPIRPHGLAPNPPQRLLGTVITDCRTRELAMAELLTLRKFEALSPFEIKNELIKLAKDSSRTTQAAFLNAGRG